MYIQNSLHLNYQDNSLDHYMINEVYFNSSFPFLLWKLGTNLPIFRCMIGTWPNDLPYNTYNTYFNSLLMVYYVNRYHFLVLFHFDFLMVRCFVPFWRIMSRTLSILIVPTTSISIPTSTSTSTTIISFMIIKWFFIRFRKWGRMGQVRLVVFQWKFIILFNHSKKIY